MPNTLTTPRLHIIACTPDLYRALFRGEKHLAEFLELGIAPGWSHFGLEPFRYGFQQIQKLPEEENWWSYLIIHRADRMLIGSGGYKGPRNRYGEVEIGYEIADAYHNRGLATEAAQAFILYAFQFPEVTKVKAHTLAQENASVQVLKKCGMRFVHTLFDPEDGELWLWEISRKSFEAIGR